MYLCAVWYLSSVMLCVCVCVGIVVSVLLALISG